MNLDISEAAKELATIFKSGKRTPRFHPVYFWLCIYFFVGGILFDTIDPRILPGFSVVEFWKSTSYLYFVVNFTAGLFAYLILIKIEKKYTAPALAGFSFGLVGIMIFIFDEIGIINVIWHGVMGTIVFIVILLYLLTEQASWELFYISGLIRQKKTVKPSVLIKRIEMARRELSSLLKIIFQMMLSFAAITGVSMSILLSNDFNLPDNKLNASKMAIGFFISSGALYIWGAAPIFRMMSRARVIERHLITGAK